MSFTGPTRETLRASGEEELTLVGWANKLMKPVTNSWTTYRRLWEGVSAGEARREAYQSMARWVADNPPFPSRAYRQWITWTYKETSSCAAG